MIPDEGRRVGVIRHDDNSDIEFGQLLDKFFGVNRPRFCPADKLWTPPTDVFETRDAIHIKMELAGVHEKDIEIKVSENFLVVRGKRCDEQHVKRENYHLMEIHYGDFERVFGLPSHMEIRNVTAQFKNGFLLVTIPKDESVVNFHIEIE